MKSITKKVLPLSLAIITFLSVSLTAMANYGHDGDKYNTDHKYSGWRNANQQYANFYCPEKYHSATARVKTKDGKIHDGKTYADAGEWANAVSGWYKNVTEWRGFYDHPNGL